MKCPKCGSELSDSIEYCPFCGSKLKTKKNNLLDKIKYLFLASPICTKIGLIVIAIQVIVILVSIFSFNLEKIAYRFFVLLALLIFDLFALYIDHRNQLGYKKLKWLKWFLIVEAVVCLSLNNVVGSSSANKTETNTKTEQKTNSLYYTTNDSTNVIKGTVGRYAYVLNKNDDKNRTFFLVDLDNGYIYVIFDQSGDAVKIAIVSGNLKDSLKVVLQNGESYTIKFKDSNTTEKAVLTVGSTGDSGTMVATDIDSVIKMINKTIVYDYSGNVEESVETKKSLYYTTNDEESVKNGDSGVYAYVKKGNEYDIYVIVDFDEGYIYYFAHGQGDVNCDKIKITSGNLKDEVVFTYDDGDMQWQEGFCFRNWSTPDKGYWIDHNGFKYEYEATDLISALALRDSKNIIDYSPK